MLPLELLDRWNKKVIGEIIIRRDTVELRCRDILVGIANRDYLRAWLRNPEGTYAYDDMAWLATGNGIALAINDVVGADHVVGVPALVLADHVLADLRAAV